MTYIPRNKVIALIPNKFEAIKVVALEARRLNERARMYNVSLPGKITTLAVDRLIAGKVEYYDTKERARQMRLEREEADQAAQEKQAALDKQAALEKEEAQEEAK